jgi:hypothetical protein
MATLEQSKNQDRVTGNGSSKWHRGPADPENYKIIWFVPWWSDQHRDLPYINEPFNNPKDQTRWRELGYTQTRFTGDMYDMRFAEPDWMQGFRNRLPMSHFSWSIYRMRPGDVLPCHSDAYVNFRRIHTLSEADIIRRYVVFLEDWQSGHYFEIDGDPMVKWSRGTAVLWHDDTEHIAANMGDTYRYTLQITGVIDSQIQNWRLAHANSAIM